MATSYEFIVVGGGIYGVASALELAGRGASVLLFERERVACGASGGLGKRGVRANGRDPRELPLMRDAYEVWPNLASRLRVDTGYERTGHIELYERECDLGTAEARVRGQTSLGIPTELLEPEAAQEFEPNLTDNIRCGVHAPYDGVADHTATTQGFAAAAARAGAEIRDQVEVTSVGADGRSVVLANGNIVESSRGILLLANSATPGLLEKSFGFQLPVWSMLPQVMRTDPLPRPLVYGLVGHAHRVLSVKALPDNAVMVSGGWRGRWNKSLKKGESDPEQVQGNWNEAVAVFPELQKHQISDVSAERLETSSLDGIPIIDRVAGAENVLYACGWSGHGWAIAPAVAPLLAKWSLDGGKTPEKLRPFGYQRFRQ